MVNNGEREDTNVSLDALGELDGDEDIERSESEDDDLIHSEGKPQKTFSWRLTSK